MIRLHSLTEDELDDLEAQLGRSEEDQFSLYGAVTYTLRAWSSIKPEKLPEAKSQRLGEWFVYRDALEEIEKVFERSKRSKKRDFPEEQWYDVMNDLGLQLKPTSNSQWFTDIILDEPFKLPTTFLLSYSIQVPVEAADEFLQELRKKWLNSALLTDFSKCNLVVAVTDIVIEV